MSDIRLFRKVTAMLACMAMLLAVLAPSVSHALSDAGKSRSLWTEICSSAGLQLVRLDAGPQSPAHGEPAGAFDHCPFCHLHGGMPAMLPSLSLVLPAYQPGPFLPVLYYRAARPLFAWSSPQSRAPPCQA